MKLSPIIKRLRERCPAFAQRVAGAAEFKSLPETSNLNTPAAYVLLLDDEATRVEAMNGYEQSVRDGFAVIVVVSNRADERGQGAADELDDHRKALWKALLGWAPDDEHGWIEYEGGEVIHMDRARLYYQFEFAADLDITAEMTGQGADLEAAPEFSGVTFGIDCIDPADPNLRTPGPDGRTEAELSFTLPTTE